MHAINIKNIVKTDKAELARPEQDAAIESGFHKILNKNMKDGPFASEEGWNRERRLVSGSDGESLSGARDGGRRFFVGLRNLMRGEAWGNSGSGEEGVKKNVDIPLEGKNGEVFGTEKLPGNRSDGGRFISGLNILMGGKGSESSVIGQNKPENAVEENSVKISVQWRNGETSKIEDLSGLKISEQYGKNTELHKIVKGKESSPKLEGNGESNDMVNLQDILGVKHNQFSSNSDAGGGMEAFQLSDVRSWDSKNLVKRITDYLVQTGIKNLDSLEVVVDHEDLGKFKIDARRAGEKGLVNLKIEVETLEGRDFFQKNESLLNRQLISAGVNLQDLKIVESKDNVLLNSFLFKQENNQFVNLDNDINNKDERSGHKREDKHDESRYNNDEEFMNEEDGDA